MLTPLALFLLGWFALRYEIQAIRPVYEKDIVNESLQDLIRTVLPVRRVAWRVGIVAGCASGILTSLCGLQVNAKLVALTVALAVTSINNWRAFHNEDTFTKVVIPFFNKSL